MWHPNFTVACPTTPSPRLEAMKLRQAQHRRSHPPPLGSPLALGFRMPLNQAPPPPQPPCGSPLGHHIPLPPPGPSAYVKDCLDKKEARIGKPLTPTMGRDGELYLRNAHGNWLRIRGKADRADTVQCNPEKVGSIPLRKFIDADPRANMHTPQSTKAVWDRLIDQSMTRLDLKSEFIHLGVFASNADKARSNDNCAFEEEDGMQRPQFATTDGMFTSCSESNIEHSLK